MSLYNIGLRGFKSPACLARRSQRGFALLITIVLMAFLVLIMVSFSALTRVEIQIATNSQQAERARQNAMTALTIALGQLQAAAGPDQRVTATADLATASPTGLRSAAGASLDPTVGALKYFDTGVLTASAPFTYGAQTNNGLSSLQAGTRFWTGVWGNALPSAPTLNNRNQFEVPPRPVLLKWLVSGNDNATATTSSVAASFGQITAWPGAGTSALAYTPASAIAGTALSTITNTTTLLSAIHADAITIGGTKAMILVGPNTVGTQTRTLEGSSTELPSERYVVAPLQDITAPAGSVPGLSATATPTIGRYAWWVGDEGVKARINLADPYAANTTATSDPLARARLMAAPRSGAEVVADTGPDALTDFADAAAAYQTASQTPVAAAKKILQLAQASFLDTAKLPAATIGRHTHDFTTYSLGLAADSYHGGLRRDLTALLEAPTLTTWTGTNGQNAGLGKGIIPTAYSPLMQTLPVSGGQEQRIPRWDVIRDFYNLPAATGNSLAGNAASDFIEMRPATENQMGITPVVVQLRLMVGIRANAAANKLRLWANPLVVLANPYPVTLNASQGLDFSYRSDGRQAATQNLSIGYPSKTSPSPYTFPLFGPSPALLRDDTTVFRIPSFSIPPGQAVIFSYQGGVAGQDLDSNPVVTLTSGVAAAAINYVYRDYAWSAAAITDAKLESDGGVRFFPSHADYTQSVSVVLAEFCLTGDSRVLQQVGAINFSRSATPTNTLPTSTTKIGLFPETRSLPVANDDRVVFVHSTQYTTPGAAVTSGTAGSFNTTLRGYADFNPRGGYFPWLQRCYFGPPYRQAFGNSMSTLDVNGFPTLAGVDSFVGLNSFTTNLVTAYWGRDVTVSGGVTKSILFDFPRRSGTNASAPNELPILSLGALQHANLGAENIPTVGVGTKSYFGTAGRAAQPSPGDQPAYALGNSYCSVMTSRAGTVGVYNYSFIPSTFIYSAKSFDISYLLNASIWDGYFLSSIPAAGSSTVPINPRYAVRSDVPPSIARLRDYKTAAAGIFIQGAFNVNSTSVDAWAAVLAGMKNLPDIPGLGSSGTNAATVFARSLYQTTPAVVTPTGKANDAYSGFRQLSDQQVRDLAVKLVQQVRMRGPFVSLSQFVNRVLVDVAGKTSGGTAQYISSTGAVTNERLRGLGQAGALQTAIDAAGINAGSGTFLADDKAVILTTDIDATVITSTTRGSSTLYEDTANTTGRYTEQPTLLQRSTGIPGWLTQADVLQALGPVLAARSDTFSIRTYGETQNPVTGSVTARAWCEAVVQRLPDYLDTATNAEIAPALASTINQTFGRRFKIVSFRWLSPNDI